MWPGAVAIPEAPRSSPGGIAAIEIQVFEVGSSLQLSPCAMYCAPSSPPSRYTIVPIDARLMWVHATGASGSWLQVNVAVSSTSTRFVISSPSARLVSNPPATTSCNPNAATPGSRARLGSWMLDHAVGGASGIASGFGGGHEHPTTASSARLRSTPKHSRFGRALLGLLGLLAPTPAAADGRDPVPVA